MYETLTVINPEDLSILHAKFEQLYLVTGSFSAMVFYVWQDNPVYEVYVGKTWQTIREKILVLLDMIDSPLHMTVIYASLVEHSCPN